MTATNRTDPASDREEPLDPAIARFLRSVCTTFGLHRGCTYKVCRRANACATRNAVCYQAMKADMQPIVLSIIARDWRRSLDRGEERDLAPAYRDDHIRRLAWEEEEIARIKSGACGGDDALTPYQFWLKYWVARVPLRLPASGAPRRLPDRRDPDRNRPAGISARGVLPTRGPSRIRSATESEAEDAG